MLLSVICYPLFLIRKPEQTPRWKPRAPQLQAEPLMRWLGRTRFGRVTCERSAKPRCLLRISPSYRFWMFLGETNRKNKPARSHVKNVKHLPHSCGHTLKSLSQLLHMCTWAPTCNKRSIFSFAKLSLTNIFTSGPSITERVSLQDGYRLVIVLVIVQSLNTSWEIYHGNWHVCK